MLDPNLLALMGAVAFAFAVEAALGFGATVVAVSLGAMWIGIDVLLPAFVPLNIVLSTTIFVRSASHVAWRFLLREVFLWMGLGLPFGMAAFHTLPEHTLKRIFGVFLIVLCIAELYKSSRNVAPAPLARPAQRALLVLGGLLHGAFATGGPAVVYVFGRNLHEKATLRATMAVLWIAANTALVVQYALAGRIHTESLTLSGTLAVALIVGMAVGEVLFRRIPEALFRNLVFGLLLIAGFVLLR